MVFVVRDVIKEFGKDTEISVITKPENINPMKEISGVNNVFSYSGDSFNFKEVSSQEFAGLIKNNFDVVIIPTNGNIDSYDNVVHFSRKIFGDILTYYYVYPDNFIRYHFKIFNEIAKTAIKILAGIATSYMLFIYSLGLLYYYIKGLLTPSQIIQSSSTINNNVNNNYSIDN